MELLELYKTLVNPVTVVAYILGTVTFLITTIVRLSTDDRKKSKKNRSILISYYSIEFIYTILALTLVVVICAFASIPPWLIMVASVMMGLFGSPLIKRFEEKENTIADRLSDTVINKIDKKVGDSIETRFDRVESEIERTFGSTEVPTDQSAESTAENDEGVEN